MRADGMACGEPFLDLRFIHQSLGNVSLRDVPVVVAADAPRHDELDRRDSMLLQHGRRTAEDALEPVVEADHHSSGRATLDLLQAFQWNRLVAETGECSALRTEQVRGRVERWIR